MTKLQAFTLGFLVTTLVTWGLAYGVFFEVLK